MQAHVDNVRAVADLPARDLGGFFPLLLRHHVLEQPASDDVGSLAHDQRPVALFGLHQLDARIVRAVRARGKPPRALAVRHLRDGPDVRVGRAAAAAHHVEPPVLDEPFELRRERSGRLEILAILIGQPRVGIARDAHRDHLTDGAYVVRHELRPGSAVEANGKQVRMRHRSAERVRRLPREHGAHSLDGGRDHGGDGPAQLAPQPFDCQQRGLDIARVLAGFDQQDVRAARDQGAGLLVEVLDQLRKRDAAGNRDGLGGWPHGPGDEPREFVRRLPRQLRRGEIQFVSIVREAILGEHQSGAAKSIGLDHIRPSFQVSAMDAEHHIRPGAHEVFIAPFERRPAEVLGGQPLLLQHGPHGPVEDEYTLLQDVFERLSALLGCGHRGCAFFSLAGAWRRLSVCRVPTLGDAWFATHKTSPQECGDGRLKVCATSDRSKGATRRKLTAREVVVLDPEIDSKP